jgi:hypothetical protein
VERRHRFSSSVAKTANVVPAERLAFFVAPPGRAKPIDDRALLDAETFNRHAPPQRSLDNQSKGLWTLLPR